MATVSNLKDFLAGLKAEPPKVKKQFAGLVYRVCLTIHTEVTETTPVWTGAALANYQWSIGAPKVSVVEFVDNGPTGHTNLMPLGPEPRRRVNEAEADATFKVVASAITDPFKMFWLANNDPDIGGLEDGELPPAPLQQRSPNGMFGLAMVYVDALWSSGRI